MNFETNRYSVPPGSASQRLVLKVYPDRLMFYDAGDQIVAVHRRVYDRHQEVELTEHLAALEAQRKQGRHQQQWVRFVSLSPVEYLARLIEAESLARDHRALERRLAAARFPVLKTLEGFNWNWPKKLNRPQVQNLFRLAFVPARSNVIFMGGVGLGKTHLAMALGHAAVVAGHNVRFAGAIEIINTLMAAQADRRLKNELQKLVHPAVLVID